MRITVYDCTQKTLVGYYIDANYTDLFNILENKHGDLCRYNDTECINTYHFNFDYIIRLGPRRFIIKNPNMSIWCKTNQNIPEYAFGDRSFVIRRG